MGRNRVAVTISIPPRLAEDYDRLARTSLYRQSQDEEAFRGLQRYGRRRARQRGIMTERDVERLVFEDR